MWNLKFTNNDEFKTFHDGHLSNQVNMVDIREHKGTFLFCIFENGKLLQTQKVLKL